MTNAEKYQRVQAIALALPEAHEVEAWGHPTFRVNNKMFAGYGVGETGTPGMSVKVEQWQQDVMIQDPRFEKAAYVGRFGWVSFHVDDRISFEEIAKLLETSYRLIAPKKLVKALDAAR